MDARTRARQNAHDERDDQWLTPWATDRRASPAADSDGSRAIPDEAPSDLAPSFYLRASKAGLIDPSDPRVTGSGAGAGAASAPGATPAAWNLAPGASPAGGGLAATGAAAAGAGPWGAVAVQAANMLAQRAEENRARKEAKQDAWAQFGADNSDFPQYGYQYQKKKRALDRQYGGAGLPGLLKKIGIG